MLVVHGDSRSGNCLKVKWLLETLARDYRWTEVDIMTGGSRTQAYLTLNPAGQVPLLILEDGRPLAQSNAILIHLAEGTRFIPQDAYDRARMLEWLFWEQYSHEPYVAVARFRVVYQGQRAEDLEPRLVERGHAALARLEQATAASPFLVGAAPTLADLALVAYTPVAPEAGFELERYPAVRAWVGRVEEVFGIS